jgi:hypothetical protein
MLEDSRQRTMEDLIPLVLQILAKNEAEKFDSRIVAKELKTEVEEVNRCFEEMRYLHLIEVQTLFGPRYFARITPLGLANLAEKKNVAEKKNG